MLGKIERHKNYGEAEDEVIRQHHRLNGHEFEQVRRVSDGQGSLVCSVRGLTKSWTQLSN